MFKEHLPCYVSENPARMRTINTQIGFQTLDQLSGHTILLLPSHGTDRESRVFSLAFISCQRKLFTVKPVLGGHPKQVVTDVRLISYVSSAFTMFNHMLQ